MGLFDNRTELQKYIAKINETTDLNLKEEEITKYTSIISENELIKILYEIVQIEDSYTYDFMEHLNTLMDIRSIIVNERNRADLESTFATVKSLYFKNRDLITRSIVEKVSNSFDDKTMIAELFRFLNNNENILTGTDSENLNILISYLEEARQYFVDDRALFSSFISLVNDLDPAKLKYGKEKQLKTSIGKKIKEDKKANGIYDIDQSTLLEMSRKIEALDLSAQRLEALIQASEEERKALQDASKNHLAELTELRIRELKSLQDEANKIIRTFNTSYAELLSQEKESIKNERDILVGELDREIATRKTQLLGIADNVGQRIGIELRRIRNVSDDSIQRIETFLASNDGVKKMLEEAKTSDEFLTRLKEVEKLAGTQVAGTNIVLPAQTIQTPGNASSVLDGLYMPSIIIPQERTVDLTPNYFFDKRIPYRDRYNQLMELKAKMIEGGAIFHEKFDDILTMVLQNDAPYMYGPSGCGKTYMIQNQLAKLLGIDVVTNGYVLYEQDILGYTNSGTGAYVPSNFYRCYKFGDIIFFDELDNGIANATTVLNSFLTGSDTDKYVFPNGEQVLRNPNFRILSAGNTKGTGKTLAHNTRQKMDESVMQRLTPIEINYDNRIEEQILRDYPGWYDFAINFRHAIESIPSEHGGDVNSIGTFTTRDAQSVKKYKDDDAMTDEQLIDYEIIENKDVDYLNQIKKKLLQAEKEGKFTTEEGRTLLKTFKTKVEGRTK